MSMKCLELGLKHKLKPNAKNAKLADLIQEAFRKGYFGRKKDFIDALRKIRNAAVHEDYEIIDFDALTTLKYVSDALNELYPFKQAEARYVCTYCKREFIVTLSKEELYVGNIVEVRCTNCGTPNRVIVHECVLYPLGKIVKIVL